MARLPDPRIATALGRVSCDVVWDSAGLWRIALTNGSVATLAARVTTDWIHVTTPVPTDDRPLVNRWALLLNGELHGAARLVRRFDREEPEVRADVDLTRGKDLGDALVSACLDLAYARHVVLAGPEGLPTSWSPRDEHGSDIVTRAGTHHARVEQSDGRARVLVELADLAGYSRPAVRAVSALLMALGASVPGVTPALHERAGRLVAVCSVSLPVPCEPHLTCGLLALSAACEASGRELHALRSADLAANYLMRAPWARRETPQRLPEEEQSCMQP